VRDTVINSWPFFFWVGKNENKKTSNFTDLKPNSQSRDRPVILTSLLTLASNRKRHKNKMIQLPPAVVLLLVNPLTPELNPSAQRCLTRVLLGILLLEPCISLIYAWKTNEYTNYSFSLLICMVAPIVVCFGITLPSSGSVPSAFWEMLNWGAVYRILWMGVVAWCVAI
jgi:hypothetical protein